MVRVSVVGTSCSGKTFIARKTASRYGIPHIELDTIFWQPNWTPKPVDQFRAEVEMYAAADQWVIDGNFRRVRDIVWGRATDVVWMNLPFALVLRRVIWRSFKRIAAKEELFTGNQETIQKALFSRDALIWWVIRTHKVRTKALRGILESGIYPQIKLHEIVKPTDNISLIEDD
jgi:adenylate kinase family enzyme